MTTQSFLGIAPPPPKSYTEFISEMRDFVESKGVAWNIPLDAQGLPHSGCDWDLRQLTNSHARHASRLNGFAVDEAMRDTAKAAGISSATLPQGAILGEGAQDFIKAVVAQRCLLAQSPLAIRHTARIYRKLFSVTVKEPWDINGEDIERFLQLPHGDDKIYSVMGRLSNLVNERMLSLHCPLEVAIPEALRVGAQIKLSTRRGGEKLPDAGALFELTRIVFQEAPLYHQDLIRFAALRLLILTGLRLNEVLMLPVDCLRWESHFDVVTGAPAGEVSGCSQSLQLRYFGEKHMEGAPDILAEERQWIPERFHSHVRQAVDVAIHATQRLREILAVQHAHPEQFPSSDLRRFKTNEGASLTTADLLFLVVFGAKGLPDSLAHDAAISTIAPSTMYQALGSSGEKSTLFKRYRSGSGSETMSIGAHSLRHLMNTELFRLNVPDTAITHQFGRQTVAQSYEYDHRNLAERLRFVTLPAGAHEHIRPGTPQDLVARMVVSGAVGGSHIERSFRKIQAEHGDAVAFQYLAANSDGFHVTPYGYCTNSFSVNPCSRHLKCFDNCKHFAASGAPEHRIRLEDLRDRLVAMHEAAIAKKSGTVGYRNQIAHSEKLLDGVQKALSAQPGTPIFPCGEDHSQSRKDLFQ